MSSEERVGEYLKDNEAKGAGGPTGEREGGKEAEVLYKS